MDYNDETISDEEKLQKEHERVSKLTPIELEMEWCLQEGIPISKELKAQLAIEKESQRIAQLSENELEKEFLKNENREDLRKEGIRNRIPWFS